MSKAVAIALVLALGVVCQRQSAFANEEPACTLRQMESDPASVIAPCSSIVGNQSAQPELRAEALFIRGRGYARTGRTGLAAQDYDVAIKLSPTKSEYYVSRASTEVRSGHSDNAFTDLQRALALDPRNARAYRALGDMYSNAGWAEDALRLDTTALSIDPREPYALLSRIGLFERKRQFPEALVDANTLVDIPAADINRLGYVDAAGYIQNFHSIALITRARLREMMGDNTSAMQDLDSVIAQAPSASGFRARADLLLKSRHDEDALRDYDAALKLDADEPDALFGRGLVLLGQKRFDLALEAFEKAAKIFRKKRNDDYMVASSSRFKARALRGLERTDDAVEAIEQAVSSSPEVENETSFAMASRGYWKQTDLNPALTSEYKAALRACMIDLDCN